MHAVAVDIAVVLLPSLCDSCSAGAEKKLPLLLHRRIAIAVVLLRSPQCRLRVKLPLLLQR